MKREDFQIGTEFICGGNRYRCTDVGTRVIVAISLDKYDDPSWHVGPPYAIQELVFDEYDMGGCSPVEG